jgi:apolipoprotein N-acyltransferase
LTLIRQRLCGLAGWRRYLLAGVLGALVTIALPPLHLWPALPVGFTGLVWILDGCGDRKSAFFAGWWFGFGFLGLGLYWISFALLIEPERVGWMIPFVVLGLPAMFAIWGGLATLTVQMLGVQGVARVILLAGAWSGGEWLRGHAFTGFPWNLIGYTAVASDALLQVVALIGIYGLGFIVVLAAAMPATLGDGGAASSRVRAYGPVAAAALLIIVVWSGGALRLLGAQDGVVSDVNLRLVQANISQHHKWQEERRRANLARYFQLSSQSGAEKTTHIIWPETAVPYFLARDPDLARAIGRLVKPGGMVITGAPRTTAEKESPFRVWNAVHAIDHDGEITGTYDKSHLLPFGEYVPFRSFLNRLGVERIAAGQGDFQAGEGATTLSLAGLPPLGVLVCYEAIFPGEIVGDANRPRWLLNLTNDAWFGQTAGPYQHFTMSRVRAAEEGIPLVRVANTGISGIADAYGRVVVQSALGETRIIDAALPVSLDALTPYARWGDAGFLIILLTLAIYTLAIKAPRIALRE